MLSAVIGGLWYSVEASKRALMVQTRLRAEAELEKHNAELAAARERNQRAIAITAMQKAESANKALVASQDSLRSTLYAAQMNLTKVAWDSGAPGACSICWSRPFRSPASPIRAVSSGTTGTGKRTANAPSVNFRPVVPRVSRFSFQSGREPARDPRRAGWPAPFTQSAHLRHPERPLAPQDTLRSTNLY